MLLAELLGLTKVSSSKLKLLFLNECVADARIPITERPKLLELINITLMKYESTSADLAGVPSKSFIWFDYDTMQPIPTDKEQKKRYDEIISDLKYKHRDISYFLLALNFDSIKDLIGQDDHFVSVGSNSMAEIKTEANKLAMKIRDVPSTFQYNKCHANQSNQSSEDIYEGYITPGYKQYWALYPEYFVKSCNIEIKVIQRLNITIKEKFSF